MKSIKIILVTVLLGLSSIGSGKDYHDFRLTENSLNTCFADFFYDMAGLDVSFYDFSWANGSVQSWSWDFGDGSFSNDQNPVHTYNQYGSYDVSLLIVADSCIDSVSYTIYLDSLSQDCMAAFYYQMSPGMPSLLFIDQSWSVNPILSWFWDFGDGTTSTDQNPEHTYNSPGFYYVFLTIFADSCTSSVTQYVWYDPGVSNDCGAEFFYNANGLSVSFYDFSWANGNIQNWFWDFGDGSSSSLQDPVHNYSTAGSYLVSLTINADSCVDTVSYLVEAGNVNPDCQASFWYVPSGLTVSFNDNSYVDSGSVQYWFWAFGDGHVSSLQDPAHQFASAGTYMVSLTIITDSCINTKELPISVWSGPGNGMPLGVNNLEDNTCQAMYYPVINGLDVEFINVSITQDSMINYVWDFGDGTTSSEKNPFHTYPGPDTYSTSLFMIGDSCTSVYMMDLIVSSATSWGNECQALFLPVLDSSGMGVNYFDLSQGGPTDWSWDFGDGSTANSQNPTHLYGQKDTYIVTLTVSAGTCSSEIAVQIDLNNETFVPLAAYNSMEENSVFEGFTLYPNPVRRYLYIEFSDTYSDQLKIDIYDIGGKVVYQTNHRITIPESQLRIDVENFKPGLYLIKCTGNHINGQLLFIR